MRSSTGKYYIALDQIRALAAFLVFIWHFLHVNNLHKTEIPIFPLSVITEGHVGVALFMCLSGYLFAKLLEGKSINYSAFVYNRALRLLPLLLLVIAVVGLERYLSGADMVSYVKRIAAGIIMPSLPNGGWSITVEFHFYLVFPLLLILSRKWEYALLLGVLVAVVVRTFFYIELGQAQSFAYWTILGRIDQFVLGIVAYQFRSLLAGRHVLFVILSIMFLVFYRWFEVRGGFYSMPSYPSPSPIWIFIPTIEAIFFSSLIAWYDNSFKHGDGRIAKAAALIGACSYSIYLLHVFFVFRIAYYINQHLVVLANVYIAILFGVLSFLLIVPLSYASYRFIELPFLRYRTRYVGGEMNPKRRA